MRYPTTPSGVPRLLCAVRRLALVGLVLSLLSACTSGTSGGAGGDAPSAGRASGDSRSARLGDERQIKASGMSRVQRQRAAQAWHHFCSHNPMWTMSLKAVVEEGGAGPYLLAENLFQYFFRASIASKPDEIERVARSAAVIGEPAVAYFAKPLVTDLVPLGKQVVCEVPDPDDPKARIKKTFEHFQIDDFIRRDAAKVLVAIGAAAVPTLSSAEVLEQARPSGRRYAAFALGRIATDEAVARLARHLRTQSDWQDRAAAAQGLGAALPKNRAAQAPLERALEDPDPFVRKQADRALAGKTKLPI